VPARYKPRRTTSRRVEIEPPLPAGRRIANRMVVVCMEEINTGVDVDDVQRGLSLAQQHIQAVVRPMLGKLGRRS